MTKLTKEEFIAAKLADEWFVKEYDTERKLKNAIEREWKAYTDLYNLPLVKKIIIGIQTPSSRTYGYIAKGEAEVEYVDGSIKNFSGFKASGGGYDKVDSVIQQVLNKCAKQNLLDYTSNEDYASKAHGFTGDEKFGGTSVGSKLANKTYTNYYNGGLSYYNRSYFNFDIKTIFQNDDFVEIEIRFKNAATGKLYARKTRAPAKKKPVAKKSPVKVAKVSKMVYGTKQRSGKISVKKTIGKKPAKVSVKKMF